jgi:hypothetical protein
MFHDLANNGPPNPAALNRRINRQHPELELVFHGDLAVRLPRERQRHCRDHYAGSFGHPHLGMLSPVHHFLQHTHVRVISGEMSDVKVRLPGDSPDL